MIIKKNTVTMREYAHNLCEKIKARPTESTIADVVNQILHETSVDGRPISRIQIEQLLGYMQEELGDYRAIKESFDNGAALSVMAMVRGMIDQSQSSGSNQTVGQSMDGLHGDSNQSVSGVKNNSLNTK